MRVFRRVRRDDGGRRRKSARCYLEFRDADGVVRRMMALEDEGASEALGRRIKRIVELRVAREQPEPDLVRHLPERVRDDLVRFGLLDASTAGRATSLSALLDEFKAALETRDRTATWIRRVIRRATETFTGAGFAMLSEVEASAIERHLAARRAKKKDDEGKEILGMSARESNHRVQACREFMRWAMERGLVERDPLASIQLANAKLDPRHVRRALREEELRKLVQAAHDGPAWRGISGPVRSLAWRLAAQVGLRVREIQSLQVRDVEQDGPDGPVLVVRAEAAKNRTEARLPLAADLARDLAPYLRGKLPTAPLLPLPLRFKDHAPRWLRRDLARAGIPYADAAGKVADVHSLRSAFVTGLVRSGANVKAVQSLARHSDPRMTVGIYSRFDAKDERQAIERTPNLSPETNVCGATGTDDATANGGWTGKWTGIGSDARSAARLGAPSNPQERPENADENAGAGSGGGIRTPDTRIMIPLL